LNLDDWQMVFTLSIITLLFVVVSPVVGAFIPDRSENFFALAVLGEDGEADDYYPGDDPNIQNGEPVNWTVYVYNHMGQFEYVSIRVKLLNTTMIPPNSTTCEPSPYNELYEVRRFVPNNHTLLYPLAWELNATDDDNHVVAINELIVNGVTADANTYSIGGKSFRIVIELWVYETETGEFVFNWSSADEDRCVWNQIWFDSIP
jgi:hypothetical protein